MKFKSARFVAVVGTIGAAVAAVAGENPSTTPGVLVDAKAMEAALSKPLTGIIFNQPIGGSSLAAYGILRTAPGTVEYHEEKSDVIYVLEGSGTFVTGGKIVGERKLAAEGEWTGTGIEGGKEVVLKKGDAIIVPKATPHWFKGVDGSIRYFAVKAGDHDVAK